MTTYVDSSALLKLYVAEPDSPTALALLESDPVLVTSWLSHVEVRRNLARVLNGTQLIKARQAENPNLCLAFALSNFEALAEYDAAVQE